jgi:hypothetical protein
MWFLQHFKKDELEIVSETTAQNNQAWSDEYIKNNWKRIVYNCLAHLAVDYEKSDQYFEDRANYLMEKYK